MLILQTSSGERCNAVEIENEKQFLDLQNRYEDENLEEKKKTDYIIKIIYLTNGELDFVCIDKLKPIEEDLSNH